MDKISLNKCRFYGYHGAFKEEQVLGQIFTVDCDLFVDLTAASQTDNLEDTVHYGMVFETIKAVVEGKPYILIEKVAGVICQEILINFQRWRRFAWPFTRKIRPLLDTMILSELNWSVNDHEASSLSQYRREYGQSTSLFTGSPRQISQSSRLPAWLSFQHL